MSKYISLFVVLIMPAALFSQSDLSFDELVSRFDNQYEAGSFDLALSTANEIREKAENEFGEESNQYAVAMHRMGLISLMLGDLSKTKSSLEKSLEVLKEISQSNSTLAAKVLTALSAYYDYSNDFTSAENCLKKALNIYKSESGTSGYDYIKTLEQLGNFYWDLNLYPKANATYKDVYDLIMNLYAADRGKINSTEYPTMVMNFATLLKEQYEYEKANTVLKDALKLTEFAKGRKHPDFRMISDEIISINILNGVKDDIDSSVIESISSWSAELGNDFEFQSEQDKMFTLDYLTQNADALYTYGLQRKEVNKFIIGDIFNFRLSTKGVVLESTYEIRNRIAHSSDEGVLRMYEDLKSLKQKISGAYSVTSGERARDKINIDSLEKASRTLEMYIANAIDTDHHLNSNNVHWQDIKNNLKQGETAIEFINFVNIRKKFYDSSYNASDSIYCAFVITADSEIPEMVYLASSSELERVLSRGSDGIYLNDPEAASQIYKLILSPLSKFLTNSKLLYISPSGILNRISFASLKNEQGEYLLDKYEIIYCGNLSEIISSDLLHVQSGFSNAVLFGGVQYDIDSTEYVNAALKTRTEYSKDETEKEFDSELGSLIVNRNSKSGGWDFLPGTMSETQMIFDELKRNSTEVVLLSGNESTESAFKNLSGKNSPALIHISTHGFFFPDPYENLNYEEKNEMSKRQTTAKGAFRKSSNPLMRSGLILAGANLLWRDGKRIEGTEDGILTAHEVSNMDLFNTELVILSACETGLGDIKNNEGVIGLQRAFKIAGVKHRIISLWNVPDKETSELMESFYRYLFRDRSTVREAFTRAQKDIRYRYNDPVFWSAFVLI